MKKLTQLFVALSSLLSLVSFAQPAHTATTETIKIACVGDSITFGYKIKARKKHCYPKQLGELLGTGYEVVNFGHSGATLLQRGDLPYIQTPQYSASLQSKPDIVIIMLGTNDSKPINWSHKEDFAADANALAQSYLELPTHPRVIFCTPILVRYARFISEQVTREEVAPAIAQTAAQLGLELVDMSPLFRGRETMLSDGVHPNAAGAELIARQLHRYLKTPRGDAAR